MAPFRTSRESRPAPGPRFARAALGLLLCAHALLALTGLKRNSVTTDEFSHLPAGIAYWQTGSFALYHHNPPLIKMLAAVPVLLEHPAVDYGGSWARAREGGFPPDHVEFATEFMRANAGRYFDLFNRARAVVVLLSVAGGLLVFLWGRDLWGYGGGLIAAALWALDPNLLAHAGVVTTDLGAAVAFVGATYAFWRWLRNPTRGRALVAGAALGLALLVKFSALLLLPVLAILAAVHALAGGRSGRGLRSRRAAARGAAVPALAVLLVNAGYGFEGTGRRLGDFPFLSVELTAPRTGGTPPSHPKSLYRMLYRDRQNRFRDSWIGRLPVPLPEQYVLGLDEQIFEANPGLPGSGYAVYLRGEVRRAGWWDYYLVALALKVPIGAWILVLAAIAAAFFLPSVRAPLFDEAALWLPAASILLATALATGLDLGVRYVLPVLPFLFVASGRLARLLEATPRRALAGTVLLSVTLFWNAVETLAAWPRYLSYFNELAGGPAGGHRYLLDSNLDWGQGLFDLKRWLAAHPPPEPPALAYFGAVDPRLAGIAYRLPPRDPRRVPPGTARPGEAASLRPGLYAISVNFVQGLPHVALAEDGEVVTVEKDAYGYFRSLRPAARAGDSIWIYRLDEEDVARIRRLWIAKEDALRPPAPSASP